MKTTYEKLSDLLKKLFQLDQADLDFGIYRIMNQKREEITRFLEKDLLPQVQEAFGIYKSVDKAEPEEGLEKTIQGAKAAGFDPEESPKVKEIRESLAKYGVDTTALENEVFSDLFNFFKRYYHEGDFLSLRRYKKGVYAIPYEGEEVKLHWANHDQYYIKTSEYFRDYTFKLPSGKHVHFKLVEADTEKDNIKAKKENERRFILCEKDFLEETGGELYTHFQYVPDPEKRKQKALNAKAVDAILNAKSFIEWRVELARLMPTDKNPERTLLEKHLTDYTARNTFDYFIHKDLGGFLKRELDFYIKNEIMHLDDIETESAPRVEQYLSKIKVIRKIAHKIIDFVAQIEDFQKKLWLKKKFVVETNYCVTLDRVPEELYPEIAANEEQREEWVKLFAIDEIEGNLIQPAYSEPLTVKFLKANPFLVVDSSFFKEKLKNKLLATFDSVDEEIEGLLVHSENFQALNLLKDRYANQIKCIYIDPPYNIQGDGFLYKDNYKRSSWLSFLADRLFLSLSLMKSEGVIFNSIDDTENYRLREIFDAVFKEDNFLSELVWNLGTGTQAGHFTRSHEYILCYAINKYILENFNSFEEGNIVHGALKKISVANPASDITFPSGMEYQGEDASFEGEIGGSEKQFIIDGPMVFEKGKLKFPITLRAGWAMRNQVISWIEGKVTYDTKGQKVNRFYFNKQGILWYEKERGKVNPKTVLTQIANTKQGSKEIIDLFGEESISFPKPSNLIGYLLKLTRDKSNDIILDFFAGSGTTAHALINLNREDGYNRKYVLVEMGEHFKTLLKPRVQKVIYSKDWKDAKPVSREGSSHMFKYIRLESYEDTLNNLEFKRTDAQQSLLEQSDSFRESYMLSYMLDVESKGSASLLNIDSFEDPFNYKLKIGTGSAGETKPVTVDLVETFNYLIGLTVHHIDHIRGFRVVQGTNPKGEKALIIWRNLKEKSNGVLDEFFRKQEYNPKDMEFDFIYVNGDNSLKNLRRDDETWKVRLIEEDFKRLMFDVQDV